jgi:hypothetical protein
MICAGSEARSAPDAFCCTKQVWSVVNPRLNEARNSQICRQASVVCLCKFRLRSDFDWRHPSVLHKLTTEKPADHDTFLVGSGRPQSWQVLKAFSNLQVLLLACDFDLDFMNWVGRTDF